MKLLTRRERDAVMIILTSFGIIFVAAFISGFFGYPYVTTGNYRSAAGLLLLLSGSYLVYRLVRRIGRYGLARLEEARS